MKQFLNIKFSRKDQRDVEWSVFADFEEYIDRTERAK